MPTPTTLTSNNLKRLSAFASAILSDTLLIPLTDSNGALGYKTSISELKNFVTKGVNPVDVINNNNADLDFADENGNVVFRIKDGHIIALNFDSNDFVTLLQQFNILSNELSDYNSLKTNFNLLTTRVATLESEIPEIDNEKEIYTHTYNNTDLDFADENGNVVFRIKDGHIKSKFFDSSNFAIVLTKVNTIENTLSNFSKSQDVYTQSYNGTSLDFADENGNVILRLKNGHIKTKNFDSSKSISIFNQTKLNKQHCICHGYGASTGAANTIPYFRAAIANGYEFFECDAVSTRDNVAVCTHAYATYQVKNRNTGENENVAFSSINYADLIATYTWTDGTEICSTKELIYYLCYIKRFPLWIDGQAITDDIRKELSQYACDLGVGEYVFHEGDKIFSDVPISNCIASGGSVNAIQAFAAQYKKSNNNIIFNISNSLTAQQIQELANAAHSVGCYISSWTFSNIENVRKYMFNGADFIITNNIVNNQI